MQLSRFPRVRLAHLPTPLEPLDRLHDLLGGPRIWIKRDDCTGLATGGNKARKLEFLFADAQAQGADCVVTCGAIQSNHVRQTAAGAALLGMRCHVLLENRTGSTDLDYLHSGNVLLDELLGAAVSVIPEGADIGQAMHDFAGELRDSGRRPYVIPGGGSNPVGALGYVNCAYELINQFTNCGIEFDGLVHATGSSGTQAGLIAGFAIAGCDLPILGIGVRARREKQENMVYELANATCSHVGNPGAVRREDVVANCDYVGAGYGVPTDGMLEALRLLATHEGILLDPVYSGKGMAGLIDLVRRGEFANARNIVFLHTGGSSALFGYRDCLSASV